MTCAGTGGAKPGTAGPALVARDGLAVGNGAITILGVEACLGRAVVLAGSVRAVRAWRAHGIRVPWSVPLLLASQPLPLHINARLENISDTDLSVINHFEESENIICDVLLVQAHH